MMRKTGSKTDSIVELKEETGKEKKKGLGVEQSVLGYTWRDIRERTFFAKIIFYLIVLL